MTRWLPLILVLIGSVVWARSIATPFVYDDRKHILENPAIRHIDQVGNILQSDRRKLVSLTLAANFAIDGENPRGYHFVNVIIHLLAGLTLFGLVRRTLLTDPLRDRFAHRAPYLAFAVALLWLLHPLTSQAVTYVIQRGESLMGLFYLLTLYCLLRGATAASRRVARPWFLFAVLACFAGMTSKEVMVTAPVVALLYDRTFLAGTFAKAVRARWPVYLGLCATWLYLAMTDISSLLIPAAPAVESRAVVGLSTSGVTPAMYLATQAGVIVHYLRLCVWPHPLVFEYGWPAATTLTQYWPQGFIILALLGATVWALWRRPLWGFIGAAFFMILAPTSSFVPILHMAFEYRMYLPLAAIIITLVFAADHLLQRKRQGAVILLVCCAIALGARTIARIGDYQSETKLWQSVVEARPENYRAWTSLGLTLQREHGDYESSVKCFKYVLKHTPTLEAFIGLGKAYEELGMIDAAAQVYREAHADMPYDVTPIFNLGSIAFTQGNMTEAESRFRQALQRDPRHVRAHDMLGVILASTDRPDEAEAVWRKGFEIHPGYVNFAHNLGVLLLKKGEAREAVEYLSRACELSPSNAMSAMFLGEAYAALGDKPHASAAYDRAMTLFQNADQRARAAAVAKRKAALDEN